MRPGWLARSLPRRKGLARSLPSMLAAQQSARALGKGLTGMPAIAVSMKLRQARAGNEPPVTRFIGVLSSLPSHTPATRSAV